MKNEAEMDSKAMWWGNHYESTMNTENVNFPPASGQRPDFVQASIWHSFLLSVDSENESMSGQAHKQQDYPVPLEAVYNEPSRRVRMSLDKIGRADGLLLESNKK